ncbi:MAG: sigma 54-interacting transcriptional regulator [Planctomycetes bacterium]|nr:sigma 54-interacting transcriptional regulator [Planctomycetota bacterium]
MAGYLLVEDSSGKRIFPAVSGRISLGRSVECTITLTDIKSSRKHCEVDFDENPPVVRDCSSLNGTALNGQLIREAPLNFGDVIMVGSTSIKYQNEDDLMETANYGAVDSGKKKAATLGAQTAALTVYDKITPHHRPKDEVDLLKQENLTLREILDVSKNLATELDSAFLLQRIVDSAIRITGAERGFLISRKDNTEDYVVDIARDTRGTSIANAESVVSKSIVHKALAGRTVVLTNASSEGEFHEIRSVRDLALRSILCVPLRMHRIVIGCIYLDNTFAEGVFADWEVKLVEAFCGQASVAVNNTKLILDNISKAKEVERLNAELSERYERQAAELISVKDLLRNTAEEFTTKYNYDNIIGRSRAMREVFKILDRVTDVDFPVLITGESGTGKELIAKAIHFNSKRRKANFVPENCGAIPAGLIESELFGHKKGSFTDAKSDKIGRIELADHGTLFLDEIGEMPVEMQKRLLRVLQDGEVRPVGAKDSLKVDFRLVCATNRDLADLVSEGLFREDLLYRIKVINIKLPTLKERKEDIPLLVDHFLSEYARENGEPKREIGSDVIVRLMQYHWPGNIRQLQTAVTQMILYSTDKVGVEHLPEEMRPLIHVEQEKPVVDMNRTLKEATEELEQQMIVEALRITRGNKTKAADILGLSRLGLRKKMERYGLEESDSN